MKDAFLVVVFVGLVAFRLYRAHRETGELGFRTCKFRPDDWAGLAENLWFFRALDEKGKKRFLRRLCAFMRGVDLHLRGNIVLEREDRMLLAAPAVMFTWGFRHLHAGNFKRIFIYPRRYYNRRTNSWHHGETHPMGVVVVSWERVEHSWSVPDDSLHLLYHEYAHALVLSRQQGEKREDKVFVRQYDRFMGHHFRGGEKMYGHFLRPYAFTNDMEFFAVCCEWLFETPDALLEKAPLLFDDLQKMLNINILEMRRRVS